MLPGKCKVVSSIPGTKEKERKNFKVRKAAQASFHTSRSNGSEGLDLLRLHCSGHRALKREAHCGGAHPENLEPHTGEESRACLVATLKQPGKALWEESYKTLLTDTREAEQMESGTSLDMNPQNKNANVPRVSPQI